MAYDASHIRVLTELEGVRNHPLMYFGVTADDPALPGVALSLAVQDALVEEVVDAPLRVRVVIDGPRRFSVEDDGPGLPVEPNGRGAPPVVTELMTTLLCGLQPIHRTGMAFVTAISTEAIADVWRDGRHYRQRADRTAEQLPLEVLEESERHGTRVTYRLDDSYLSPSAELPRDVEALLSGVFDLPHHSSRAPRPAPGTTIDLLDRRNGTTAQIRRPAPER